MSGAPRNRSSQAGRSRRRLRMPTGAAKKVHDLTPVIRGTLKAFRTRTGRQDAAVASEFRTHPSKLRDSSCHHCHALTVQLFESDEPATQCQDEPLDGPQDSGSCARRPIGIGRRHPEVAKELLARVEATAPEVLG